MNRINFSAEKKELRNFGIIMALAIILFFGLLLPLIFKKPIGKNIWPYAISVSFLLPALFVPVVLKPAYTIWMFVGSILGWINTRIILGLFFYFILAPIGIILKIFRNDPMKRSLNAKDSYLEKCPDKPKEHMERPY